MIFCFFIFLIFLKSFEAAAIIHDCADAHIVTLPLNEIAFFETSNFPRFFNFSQNGENLFCNLTFLLDSNNTTNSFNKITAYAAISVYGTCVFKHDNPLWNTQFYYLKNVTNFSPQNYISFEMICTSFTIYVRNIAFQGNILFENLSSNNISRCPLESIAKPFQFRDETQIIHLRSIYEENQNQRLHPCKWNFTAPFGYGFKIVISSFNISVTTQFYVKNTTDILINHKSAIINHPYYNSDSSMQIYLSPSSQYFLVNVSEFQAYISVVKKSANKIDGNCSISHSDEDDAIIWKNYNNPNQGIANNIFCKYVLTIPKNYDVYIRAVLPLESDGDYIVYYEDENNVMQLPENDFMLASSNDSDKNVIFEFISDGSVSSLDFEIFFYMLYCECGNYEILCDGSRTYLMNNSSRIHCGNLNCVFNIQACPTNYIWLNIVYEGYGDVIKVISNNEIVFQTSNVGNGFIDIFLNSSAKNILEVFTHSSTEVKDITFISSKFDITAPDRYIVLTNDESFHIIDTNIFNFFVIEITDSMKNKNLSISLQSNSKGVVGVYTDETLKTYMYECANFFKCVVQRDKIAIHSVVDPSSIITVQLTGQQRGCVFNNTVFNPGYQNLTNNKPIAVAALANNDDLCQIAIIPDYGGPFAISSLWTTSVNENVQVFIGENQTKLLFEFNTKTSNFFKNIILNSNIYIIKLPKSSALLITLIGIEEVILPGAGNIYQQYFYLPILSYPFHSIIASPYYYTSASDIQIGSFFAFIIGNISVKFTVLDYTLTETEIFAFFVGNDTIRINSTGEYAIFKNQQILLSFMIQKELQHGVLFFIEALNN